MIVNQAFVRHFFAGRNPIGQKVHGWASWFRIVGVAKDSKYHYLGEGETPYFYVPFRQIYRTDMNLAFYVRAHGDLDSTLRTLRTQTRAIDPNVTVFDATPLKEFIGASLFPQKMAASLMTVLGSIAVLLAAMGGHVLRLVVRQGLLISAGGLAAGIALALALSRAVAALSYTNSAMGTRPKLMGGAASDPLIYLGAALFLCALSALAAYLPARRAASIDPMQALRME
jgi:hypothetical protein